MLKHINGHNVSAGGYSHDSSMSKADFSISIIRSSKGERLTSLPLV